MKAEILKAVIIILFTATFSGLAYTLMRAISSGAKAYSSVYSEAASREFEDLFLFIPPRRIAEAGWAVAATIFITVFFLTGSLTSMRGFCIGLFLATTSGLIALRSPEFLLSVLRKRRLKRFNIQLVDTLISMSNALKAGFSITQTFESVVKDGENPIAQEFAVFLQETRVGVSFSDALSNMEQRVDSEDLTLVVMAIETARKTGGNLTEIFEKISKTIRERMRIENRIRTLTSQGRLQGIIVGSMPVVIAIALFIVDPEMMVPFLHSMTGIVVITAVVLLVSCGGVLIRKIINIDV